LNSCYFATLGIKLCIKALKNEEKFLTDLDSDQMVLDGITGSGGSRGDLDFVVDRREVSVDGAVADRELISDVRVAESLC
jgi:hypothetical protein